MKKEEEQKSLAKKLKLLISLKNDYDQDTEEEDKPSMLSTVDFDGTNEK